ncbi:MAG TPA: FAD-binding oxidoreductase, partial [Candidatus Limnocylindria bacterium]|nr:FAD-binding oxidoreductase [Candidatus Limnocylindria bacterium]
MQLLSALRDIVGDAQVLTDADLKASYETDWTRRFSGAALAVVRPASVDEVAAVVRCCADAGVAIVPQGGNTGLVGGSVPRGGEVVLSLARLRSLAPVEGDAVTAGAGATLAALQAHAVAAGWEFGVDLGARDSATIGGMIATNAGGINVLRHGSMRQQLLGVEAVLADGSVVSRLAGLRKDNTGYDLAGLLCGSEGTLGIVTAARLRLVPPLPRRALALLGLPSVEAAIEVASAARRELPSLLAAELFFEEGLSLVVGHTGASRPFAALHGAYLLLEVAAKEDPTDEIVGFLGDRDDVLLAGDPAGRRRLWELRERHTEAIASAGIVHKLDVSLPPQRLAEFVGRIGPRLEAAVPGARLILYGHIAEANLHV